MRVRNIRYTTLLKYAGIAALLAALGWIAFQIWNPWSKPEPAAVPASSLFEANGANAYKAGLPEEGRFERIADNDDFSLLADPSTAHFQIIDKSSGKIWRSYPEPEHWSAETATGTWKNHLTSPILLEYVNAKNYKSSSVTAGLIENQGYLEQFETTADGFSVTFAFPKLQFKIPIEVRLHSDYVETRLIDEGIVEGELSLLNVKLYPLFGAQPSIGQEGYLMLPDGSGALIRFEQERIMQLLTYNESVYGPDLSYYNENTARQRIGLPVYGLKSGEQAFVALITEGEEFANVYAAPSGSVGRSNWITTEWQFRKRFFQSVSKSTGEGFYTYSEERFATGSRATRYYPLASNKSDYAGMAEVYRNYLIAEQSVAPLKDVKEEVPLYVDIVGADIEKGLFFDSYLKATSTDEASQLVEEIYHAGIQHLKISYAGWQQDGYSTQGGYFPVDKRIGGDAGMKQFIAKAHSLDIPVYLAANYTFNTNGDDGFWWRRDGLRNLAGTVLEHAENPDQDPSIFVSPKFYEKTIHADLSKFKSLGADGIYYEDGIGQQVNTDFNSRYRASREEVVALQHSILSKSKEELGSVIANNPNFYALDQLDHVHRLTGDYSYDAFVSEPIPFAQMVLHGLRTYTLEWSNMRDEWEDEFLRSIEYGAYPAYVLSGDRSDNLKQAYTLRQYSLNYKDWLGRITEEYGRSNEALAPVQNRVITEHRTLAPGVKETVYEGNYRIIVNYNETSYSKDGTVVPAKDFIVIEGGTAS